MGEKGNKMSGLLALLDDVAAIAKVAASSVDDIAAAAAKAGAKAAGVVIDDAAVTPKYVHGFAAARELPIVWHIAKGSVKNKLVILLPALLALDYFLPSAITPLLMLGGAYLCFEGAEKLLHSFAPHADNDVAADFDTGDAAHLEAEKVAGAIKTDFILSAEIMTIAMATLPESGLVMRAITLALVGVMITAAVYGAVGFIVKMDDIGLHMAANRKTRAARAFGRGLVLAMPRVMSVLSVVGTAAMLWVGGSIVVHGLEVTHLWAWPYVTIHHLAEIAADALPAASGLIAWAVTALFDGIIGVILGMALVPLVTKVMMPIWNSVQKK
jgi:predicted DNA repair protein MutK